MQNKDWRERYIDLTANVLLELMAAKEINVVMIQNTDTSSNIIYAGFESGTSNLSYDTKISPGQWGILARPFMFRQAYLFSTGNISRVKIIEMVAPDPHSMLKSIIGQGAQAVDVNSTVGLKASELNIEATTKNLFVKDVSSPGVVAGQLTANTTAQRLASDGKCREVLIQSPVTNSEKIYLGDSTNQIIELLPGDALSIPVDNIKHLFVKTTTSTATVNWLSRS